jgi:hypothetical protein
MITLCISSSSRGFKGLLDEVANSCDDSTPDGVGLAPKVGRQQADVAGHNMRQPVGFKVTHSERKEKKRKAKNTTPFSINLMRSQVLYRAAQTLRGIKVVLALTFRSNSCTAWDMS